MIRLLIAVCLLAGCAQQQSGEPRPTNTHTTVYKITSEPCEPALPDNEQLKRALKSRDEWKRYAESLEKLPGAQPRMHGDADEAR